MSGDVTIVFKTKARGHRYRCGDAEKMNRNHHEHLHLPLPDVETNESSTSRDRPHKRLSLSHHRPKESRAASMKESSMPSMCAGVYRSHAKGDKAFEPISLEDLNSVLDTGCVDDKLSNVYIGRRNSMVRRLSIDSRASTAWLVMNNPALVETHDQNEDIDEEETSRPGTPTSKPRASVLLPPPSNVVNRRRCTSELEHRLIVSRLSTDLTSLTIRKWRQQKQISDSPLRTFAKDEMHFNLLEKLSDKIAVSVPMPLVIEICKEAYPIIAETVVTYERYLGKNNSMTKESAARFKEIQEMHDMYNNI